MSDIVIGAVCMLASLVLIQSGMHIGIALMLISFGGVWAIKSAAVAGKLLASSVTTSIASEVFGVIPLFVIMGLFVSVTGMGRDTFDVAAHVTRRLRGGLGIATVAANAVFAACTGTSIASASIFTKVAVPEMVRHGYRLPFAVGVVTGSSVLGMLIPPSLLMIIFGVLANTSIGDLFTAGILPGILLAASFSLCIFILSRFQPERVFDGQSAHDKGEFDGMSAWTMAVKLFPICILIGIVLGGIYGGFFTPTEAGGAGAFAAFLIGVARREITLKVFWDVSLEAGKITAAICFLLMAAQLYSQMLTFSGLPYAVGQWLQSAGLSFLVVLFGYLAVVLLLGCFLDSLSIMLIILPFVLPVIDGFGVNLVWFGLITIITIEIGLLTPPLGLSAFVVKANLGDAKITTWQIFMGTMPMTITMTLFLLVTVFFPSISLVLLGRSWSWW
ncbi:MAG: TRAP transporter large permease subunit [Rhodopseudomonas sp.]|nr:TRAP transporter large permease subunit [Rhodopseudomonas sp.]